jgi:predicted solute-binding protein
VALLPTWDFLKVGRMNLVTSAAVSVYGPSNTYLLCSKVLPSEIQRVLVDHESFGGRSLSEFLLPPQTGSRPEYTRSDVPLKYNYDFEGDPHDAFLLVGENALLAPRSIFTWTYDLGGGWSKLTNAPFVMHVWCCHRGVDLRGVEKEILDACRASTSHIPEIVHKEKERLGVATGLEMVYQKLYKTDCGPTEIAALRQYAQELAKAQLTRGPQFMVYRPPVGVGGAVGVR